jgi:3-hydroxyisobutyrate dehydrogenase
MDATGQKTHLGFIGLGQMGAALAERLIAPDVTLHVHDPSRAAVAPFVEAGAIPHDGPRAVADRAGIVFACLPDGKVSETVAFGPTGVAGGSAIRTYVEMSTIGSNCIETIAARLAEHGIRTVDAPVSAGPKGARAGILTIMTAGAAEDLASVDPWLKRIGRSIITVDAKPGRAQVMKLVNNLISAAAMASSFETIVMGAKAGLDPDLMLEVLNASSARNSATLEKLPKAILPGTFDFGATVRTIFKDIELGLAEANRLGVPMWTGQAVAQVWRFAMMQGAADKDYTSLIRFMEEWAGVEVRGIGARAAQVPVAAKTH